MNFTKGNSVVFKHVGTSDTGNQVFEALEDQPETTSLKETKAYCDEAVEDGDLAGGDIVLMVKINSHSIVEAAVSLRPIKPKVKENDEGDDPTEGEDAGGDDI